MAIAIGILVASGQIRASGGPWAVLGELSLGGQVLPVPGMLPMVSTLATQGHRRVAVPAGNAPEARMVADVEVVGVEGLDDVARLVAGPRGRTADAARRRPAHQVSGSAMGADDAARGRASGTLSGPGLAAADMADVRGQPMARWALEVALAGGHDLLLVGSPGAGKTLLARTVPSLLPPLDDDEAQEVAVIRSVAGLRPDPTERRGAALPCAAPHEVSSSTRIRYDGDMAAPVAYLRRSSSSTNHGAGRISYAVQEASVLDMAQRHGDPQPELIVEWGVSGASATGSMGGTGRGGRRTAYHQLRQRIADGDVSALYAYSLSRLARSTRDLLDLAETCATAGVPVRLAKEGVLDFATPHGRLYLTVLAAVATFEAEVSAERGKDRTAAARDRGAWVGRPPFGFRHAPDGTLTRYDPEAVVVDMVTALYLEQGRNARATIRVLNDKGIPSPTGGTWGDATIRRLIGRDGGHVTSGDRDRTRQGSRIAHSAAFSRLLVCAECGHYLTSTGKRYTTAAGEPRHWRGYTCQGARLTDAHSRPAAISEAAVLTWATGEVARLRVPADQLQLAADASRERAELDARRERVADMVEAGTISRQEAEPRFARIAADMAVLESRASVVDIPQVDWAWPPARLGPVLGAIFDHVTVDLPAGTFKATWQVPEWRAGH